MRKHLFVLALCSSILSFRLNFKVFRSTDIYTQIIVAFKSAWGLNASGDLDCNRRAVWSHFQGFIFGCFCFFMFKKRPHLLQLFRRSLQHCCAVKLQECFVDYKKPHLTSHRHRGEKIMTEFHLFGELILQTPVCTGASSSH